MSPLCSSSSPRVYSIYPIDLQFCQDTPRANPSTNGSTAAIHMTTRPVTLPHCATGRTLRLTLNVEVSVGGNLSVAVLATAGGALQGFGHDDASPIVGNRLAGTVGFVRPVRCRLWISATHSC